MGDATTGVLSDEVSKSNVLTGDWGGVSMCVINCCTSGRSVELCLTVVTCTNLKWLVCVTEGSLESGESPVNLTAEKYSVCVGVSVEVL